MRVIIRSQMKWGIYILFYLVEADASTTQIHRYVLFHHQRYKGV